MASADPPRGLGILILIFRLCVFVFYHSVSIVGQSLVPKKGAVIVTANHGNSLMDAQMVLTSCPRRVRLTAKDTLWKSTWWRFWLSNTGTIPIKRAMDHAGEKVDNTSSFDALYKVLDNGGCIGLFPEGISRYRPWLSPLKPGVARIALESVARNKDPDFSCAIQPCGLTYMHRDKFRSDVVCRFGEPIVVDRKTYPKLDSAEERGALSRRITEELEKRIKALKLEAPDWPTYGVAHTCRRLRRPLGLVAPLNTSMSVMQGFLEALALESPPAHVAELKAKAAAFQQRIDRLGVTQELVRRRPSVIACAWRVLLRALSAAFLLSLALPGIVILSPLFVASRYVEGYCMRRAGGAEMNQDEVAQFKISAAVVILPTLLSLSTTASWAFLGARATAALAAGLPLLLWLTLRWLEDGTHSARTMLLYWRWMTLAPSVKREVRAECAAVEGLVARVAEEFGVPDYKDARPASVIDYFNPVRRRKKSVSELLKLRPALNEMYNEDQCPRKDE